MKDQELVLRILNQIYKCPEGNYLAIAEVLQTFAGSIPAGNESESLEKVWSITHA